MNTIRQLLTYALCACLLLAARSANAVTMRFEAEAIGPPYNQGDVVGYDNTVTGPLRTTDATASNGLILEASATVNNRLKVGFVGTGLDLITRLDTDGGDFDWILDEGALSGSGTTTNATRVDQASIPIVSGLANTLHTLELRRKSAGVLRIDAVDVLDAGSQTRYEQDSASITPGGVWNLNFAGNSAEASGSSIGFTTCGPGSGGPCGPDTPTLTLNFTGTAVSLLAQVRSNSQNWTYNIDNGAATGTVNFVGLVPNGIWQRWPVLLANNLAPGNHTLVLTSAVPAGVPGIAVHIDGIDVFGVPEPTGFVLSLLAMATLTAMRRRI